MFSKLLSAFTGHSLTEEIELWDAMKHLKTARNNFVHGGVACIGKNPANPALTSDQALKLLQKANKAIETVRGWLPDPAPWPPFTHKHEIQFMMLLAEVPPIPAPTPSEPTPDAGGST